MLHIGSRDRSLNAGVDVFEIDDYTTVDAGLGYDLPCGQVDLQVTNLLNNDYIDAVSQSRFGLLSNRRFGAFGR